MNADTVLFVGLVIAWMVLRVGTRSWVERRLKTGAISANGALYLQAATFAVLPLFAIPWRNSLSDIAVLVGLSVALFFIQVVVMRIILRYMQGRSTPPSR